MHTIFYYHAALTPSNVVDLLRLVGLHPTEPLPTIPIGNINYFARDAENGDVISVTIIPSSERNYKLILGYNLSPLLIERVGDVVVPWSIRGDMQLIYTKCTCEKYRWIDWWESDDYGYHPACWRDDLGDELHDESYSTLCDNCRDKLVNMDVHDYYFKQKESE